MLRDFVRDLPNKPDNVMTYYNKCVLCCECLGFFSICRLIFFFSNLLSVTVNNYTYIAKICDDFHKYITVSVPSSNLDLLSDLASPGNEFDLDSLTGQLASTNITHTQLQPIQGNRIIY